MDLNNNNNRFTAVFQENLPEPVCENGGTPTVSTVPHSSPDYSSAFTKLN